MDIAYAILGLLSWQSLTGYDLKKIIAESELFYWSGNNNQIYNSLVSLHRQELVTQQVQVQESLPAKKIYTITEQGRAALRRWLLSEPELPEIRSSFLIQLSFSGALSRAELDALLGTYEAEISVQLRMRLAHAQRHPAAEGEPLTEGQPLPAGKLPHQQTPRERYLWEKISANLVGAYQHELDWVRDLRQGLAELDEQNTQTGGTTA